MYKNWHPDIIISYLLYLYPFFLILGPAVNNFFHLIILLFSIFILFKKNFFLTLVQKKIVKMLIFLFLYSVSLTILNENYFFLKNSIFFIKLISFMFVISYLINEKRFNFNYFLTFNLLILIVVIFDTFFQFKFGYNILGYEIEPNNKIRLTSFFKDEYVVGSFISKIFLPVLIGTYVYLDQNKYKNILFILFSNLIILAVLITGERSSLIITIVSFFFCFILINKIRKLFIINAILSIFFIGLILTSSPTLKKRFINETIENTLKIEVSDTVIKDKNIFNSHYGAIFLASKEIIKDNILFGNGLRSYRIITCNSETRNDLIKKLENDTNHADFICSTHPHNFILELMVDLGLIGLIIFLFILFNCLIEIIKIKNSKRSLIIDKNIIISFGIQFLAMFWPLTTHGSIFSSWNSSFIILNFCIFYSLLAYKNKS